MSARHLPSRFPVGTRYVIEGRRGKEGELRIVSRRLIMPDGEAIDLKAGVSFPRPMRGSARLRRNRA